MERQSYQPTARAHVAAYPAEAGDVDTPNSTQNGDAAAQEHLGLGAIGAQLRQRLLSLGTMNWPQRVLTVFVIGAVAVMGLLILVGTSGPSVHISGGGSVPQAILVGVVLSLVVSWSLLLTGAIHSTWFVRWPGLVLFTLLAVVEALRTDDAQGGAHLSSGAALLPLACIWVWALFVGMRQRSLTRAEQRAPGRAGATRPDTRLWVVTVVLVLGALTVHEAQVLAPPSGTASLEFAAGQVSLHLTLLFLLLIPLLLVAGTHFAEWGQTAGTVLAASLIRRGSTHRHGGLVLVTILVALAISLHLMAEPAATLGFTSPVVEVIASGLVLPLVWRLVLAVLRWLGHLERWPRLDVPRTGMVAALYAGIVVPVVVLVVSISVASSSQGTPAQDSPWGGLPVLASLLAVPVASLVLLIRGRGRPGQSAVTGLFLLITLLTAPVTIVHMADKIPGFELFVAPPTVVTLLWLAVRRKLTAQRFDFVRLLLVLNVGLEVVELLRNGFPSIGVDALTGSSAAAPVDSQASGSSGLLYILVFLWALLLSGGEGANVDGARLGRSVRLLLFFGYNLLLSTLILFLSSVFPTGGGDSGPNGLSFDAVNRSFASLGLQLLGVPLLLTLFVLGVSRRQSTPRAAREARTLPVAASAPPPARRRR